ncbi:MAG: hypothetical protein AAGD10_06735 [Myxococcota bacterium]
MRSLASLAFVALLLGAGLDVWVGLRPEPSPIRAEDLRSALAHFRAETRPGAVLVHSPLLSPEDLKLLGDLGATPTPVRWGQSWVLDDARQPMYAPGREMERIRFGELVLRRMEIEKTAEEGGYQLLRELRADSLRLEDKKGGVVSRCRIPRSAGGYDCPGQPEWVYAAPTELIIEGATRNCVWAHPRNDLSLVFDLPAPDAPGRLRVGAGLSDGAVTMKDGAPVEVEVRQGRSLAKISVPNRRGWRERRVGVEAGTRIELRIKTRHDGMRHLCIDASIESPAMPQGQAP